MGLYVRGAGELGISTLSPIAFVDAGALGIYYRYDMLYDDGSIWRFKCQPLPRLHSLLLFIPFPPLARFPLPPSLAHHAPIPEKTSEQEHTIIFPVAPYILLGSAHRLKLVFIGNFSVLPYCYRLSADYRKNSNCPCARALELPLSKVKCFNFFIFRFISRGRVLIFCRVFTQFQEE